MALKENIADLFVSRYNTTPSIIKIQGDASNRQYFRVIGSDISTIGCYDPAFENSSIETYPFLILHDLLSQNGIPIPEVIAVDAEKGLLLLEDCGDLLLQNVFSSPIKQTIPELYRQTMAILIEIQEIKGNQKSIPFNSSFDMEKLMSEFDFFITNGLLNYFSEVFDRQLIGSLRYEFETIAQLLVKPYHFVLNHRDFHSRNILIYHNNPVIIDFQDARMGLPQYDAVSLLKDSYVQIELSLTEELKTYHYNTLRSHNLSTMSFDEYLFYFDIMAFQRNIKAIGTFCYQTKVKKNNNFEHSIAPTLNYIRDYIKERYELKRAGQLLKTLFEETEQ
ncbi:MAG: phosphotransferase [Chlorobiaceae bacterium]